MTNAYSTFFVAPSLPPPFAVIEVPLTQAEACKRLHVGRTTFKAWEKAGRIKAVLMLPGGNKRYAVRDVDRLRG